MDHNIYTSKTKSLRRSGLGKKIKKNLQKKFSIFISTPPGFSAIAMDEIHKNLGKPENLHLTKGGISFKGDIGQIFKSNLTLGVPSRVLVRIGKFRCDNFSLLIKEFKKLPFELFLIQNKEINIHVTSKKSKLIHTDAVKERVEKAIKERLLQNESAICDGDITNAGVFVRISNDTIIVSIDSSGTPLYKRGVKKFIAHAPIRENLAYSSLLKSGYTGDTALFDPMCGSGTFSIEGAMLANRIPPGFFREFAFMSWPLFERETYKNLLQKYESDFKEAASPIFTSDLDYKNLVLTQKNIDNFSFKKSIKLSCMNFFDIPSMQKPCTIALNPPYGIRLEKEKKLIKKIELKFKRDFKESKIILTIPENLSTDYFSKKYFDSINFVHGGIDMLLLTGKIK